MDSGLRTHRRYLKRSIKHRHSSGHHHPYRVLLEGETELGLASSRRSIRYQTWLRQPVVGNDTRPSMDSESSVGNGPWSDLQVSVEWDPRD